MNYQIAGHSQGQNKMVKNRGSVLIFVLWILMVLAVLVASVGFISRIDIQLSSMRDREEVGLYEFLSGVNLASYFINQDEDGSNDSTLDPWYGEPKEYQRFAISKKLSMTITDEEGKLNINKLTPEILQNLFKILIKTVLFY